MVVDAPDLLARLRLHRLEGAAHRAEDDPICTHSGTSRQGPFRLELPARLAGVGTNREHAAIGVGIFDVHESRSASCFGLEPIAPRTSRPVFLSRLGVEGVVHAVVGADVDAAVRDHRGAVDAPPPHAGFRAPVTLAVGRKCGHISVSPAITTPRSGSGTVLVFAALWSPVFRDPPGRLDQRPGSFRPNRSPNSRGAGGTGRRRRGRYPRTSRRPACAARRDRANPNSRR